MTALGWAAASFATSAALLHLVTIAIGIRRCRPASRATMRPTGAPPITLIRPVRGVEPMDEITLRSSFSLAYPCYEVIFCVARADDPATSIVRRLIAEHPSIPTQLLVGDDHSTANPKLNNVIKGWEAARHDWIVISDSNVLMPGDCLHRLLGKWRSDTGLVCSPPVGSHPSGFWAELECAFLNTYQARWQYAADTIGLGFAQGKTMLWRRETLERAGGIRALGCEIAEDAAATKVVCGMGLHVRLVDNPFPQPLGMRGARSVWVRQLRWARLRRATFAFYFVPELITGAMPPLLAAGYASSDAGVDPLPVVVLFALQWYAAEVMLARLARWHLSTWTLAAWILRDMLLPVLWIQAWLGNGFEWRGNVMSVRTETADAAAVGAGPGPGP